MSEIREQRLTGERALFHSQDLDIAYCIFADGESPLKESRDIRVTNSSFQWKYPFWYCKNITVKDSAFLEMARAGIWYGENISIRDSLYEAPKGFRRINGLKLHKVDIPHALETLWHCKNVELSDVSASGDYFGMNCENLRIENFRLSGNYCFDGCKNIEVHNAKLLSRDAFWNCENVVVYDSYINGEYLGWNSRNIKFVNCVIESLQGMCYMDHVVMENCKLLNTTLAFEYSTVEADIDSEIESVINPAGGKIACKDIHELILQEEEIDPSKTEIIKR